MNDENGAPKRLTLEDPVDSTTLNHLETLHGHWMDLAERNARLDQDKIQILAALRRLDAERSKIFESVLIERGFSPATRVTIDSKTRLVEVLDDERPLPQVEPEPEQPEPEPEPEPEPASE